MTKTIIPIQFFEVEGLGMTGYIYCKMLMHVLEETHTASNRAVTVARETKNTRCPAELYGALNLTSN